MLSLDDDFSDLVTWKTRGGNFIFVFFILVTLLTLIITIGCSIDYEKTKDIPEKTSSRFVYVEEFPRNSSSWKQAPSVKIILDTETGIKYICFIMDGNSAGVTKFIKKDNNNDKSNSEKSHQ